LAPALDEVAEWIRNHPSWEVLDPRELSKSLRDIDTWHLALALRLLVEKGFFRQVYKVVTPSGVLADDIFDDPRLIPDRLPDRWNQYFDTSEADVVAVLAVRE
jgi:hypothetical protein